VAIACRDGVDVGSIQDVTLVDFAAQFSLDTLPSRSFPSGATAEDPPPFGKHEVVLTHTRRIARSGAAALAGTGVPIDWIRTLHDERDGVPERAPTE